MNEFVTLETIGKEAKDMSHKMSISPNSSGANSFIVPSISELCHSGHECRASDSPNSRGGLHSHLLGVLCGHAAGFEPQSVSKSKVCLFWAEVLRTEVGFAVASCHGNHPPSRQAHFCQPADQSGNDVKESPSQEQAYRVREKHMSAFFSHDILELWPWHNLTYYANTKN